MKSEKIEEIQVGHNGGDRTGEIEYKGGFLCMACFCFSF
jgi:hypothetical protein